MTDSGRTAIEHFDLLYMVEGNVTAQCLGGKRSAFTAPHSHVVFICGQVLQPVADQDPASAIHELLHTLGLGETHPARAQSPIASPNGAEGNGACAPMTCHPSGDTSRAHRIACVGR